MPLLGSAAMLLSFDVVPESVAEHDHWHTVEHLPERLSIPGFLRGTRWVALEGQPRYMVLYEVEALATLTSAAYLERLNNPSPWTTNIMPSYRGMRRGFCAVAGSFGHGLGHLCALRAVQAASRRGRAAPVVARTMRCPRCRAARGSAACIGSQGALTPAMTHEQRIRGADAGVDSALLVTGYDRAVLTALLQVELGADSLAQHGALEVTQALYRTDYSLTRQYAARCARFHRHRRAAPTAAPIPCRR